MRTREQILAELQEATDSAVDLRKEVHVAVRAAQGAQRHSVFSAVSALCSVVMLGVVLYLGAHLYDCLSPSGTCAKRGARQTSAAIANIEIRRNQTELERAQEQGNQKDIEFRERKIKDLKAEADAILASK